MTGTKWFARPIYLILALALMLSFNLVTAVPVAALSTTTTTLTVPNNVYRPAEFVASSTTTNSGTAYTNVRFNITLSGPVDFTGDRANTFTITKVNGSTDTQGINDTFVLLSGNWVVYWGPAGGFPLSDPYSATSTFTIEMCDTGTAPLGGYDVTVELVNLIPEPDVQLSEATDSFTLSTTASVTNVNTGEGFNSIQAAIDDADTLDGHTINVGTGTYNEAILIDSKDLTIQAASIPVLTGLTDGDYIIKVANADVTLDGLTVNGTGNNINYGIWYYDASGEVKNCTVQGIEQDTGGNSAIRIENSAVDITDNLLKEFRRNGIFVRDFGSSGKTISGNEIVCHSIDAVNDAYHGIEIGWGVQDVTIQGNTVYDHVISTIGLLDWSWSSQGIVVWGHTGDPIMTSTADILNNTVHHVMEGIHIGYQQLDGDTSYANIIGNHVYDCCWGIGVVSDANASINDNTIEMFDQDVIDFVADWGEGIWVGGSYSGSFVEDSTADITNNTVTNCDMGIDLFENAAITATGNTITNCDYGIKTNNSGSETWAQTVTANFNNIYSNTIYGCDNSVNTVAVFDAENNWWGANDGPSGVGPGSGDAVTANVDYDPWLGAESTEVVSETVSGSGTITDTAIGGQITISGVGNHTITTVTYAENPCCSCPFSNAGCYYDINLDSTDGLTSLTVQFCPALQGTTITYWDGAGWVTASNQVYADGCITVTITDETVPSLSELTGTPFGQGFLPPVGGVAYSVNNAGIVLPWIVLGMAAITGSGLFILRRRKAKILN